MLNISKNLKYVYTNSEKSSKNSKKSFIIFHENLIEPILDKISGNGFKLYYILRSYSDGNYKPCFPSTKKLASRMNVSEETVRRCIKELENHNLIHVQRHCSGNRNIYHFQSPHTDDNTIENDTLNPTKFEGQLPHTCGNINKQYSENQKLRQQQLTYHDKVSDHKNSVVAVDNFSVIKELTEKYKKLQSNLNTVPYENINVSDTLINSMKINNNPDMVDLVISYTSWINISKNTKVHNFIGFVKWQLKNPLETDYGQYFDYLEKLYRKQQIKKKQIDEHNKIQQDNANKEIHSPSKEEVDTFFTQLKHAVGKRL